MKIQRESFLDVIKDFPKDYVIVSYFLKCLKTLHLFALSFSLKLRKTEDLFIYSYL